MSNQNPMQAARASLLALEYPQSLGVYDDYLGAQRAVDFLSDREFPVENCMIVGTDLKQVERVTARLTWGRVIASGLASGAWIGLLFGLLLSLFDAGSNKLGVIIGGILFGAFFGLVYAAVGYSMSQGRRDFTSVSTIVATRYEVLVEHKFAEQGRDLLSQLDAGLQRPQA
ncbi:MULTISPECIES: general stress protein [Allobranchiibius]|uniref:General stress protein 17M-like domain-containing protein n=1 Tax=Allobranchiibius huperziae TaxID=1874116 RepID=A0A853DDR5_9MICO|nr:MULTISPECIES: general stress protein [Allobranchiibius]MBO1765407.1 hypothetical protein [Allobranchiibius sp. GilTou38]NYJ73224.1 hypothetical protein [Allobranchiibius huperziae]UIJ35272.1 hypothetical protein LVQ62_02475 [Allobranchiibius sp. GilTou73]